MLTSASQTVLLRRLRSEHGVALLWDAHSVASEVPGLFAGVLPEFNFGTRDNSSCPRSLAETLLEQVTRDGKYGAVLNGRFKGGYTTLHYGRPAEGYYAIQLELAQRMYIEERSPTPWDSAKADAATSMIRELVKLYVERGGSPPRGRSPKCFAPRSWNPSTDGPSRSPPIPPAGLRA
jgi:N-formylglutamate deformylase